MDNKLLVNELDRACKKLASLMRNPYAIERREDRIKKEQEHIRYAWENFTPVLRRRI